MRIGGQQMSVVNLPIGLVYSVVLVGFALMTWRSIDVAIANWRARRRCSRSRNWRRSQLEGFSMSPAGFKLLFLALMGSGMPVAIAMAGSSLIFVMATGLVPDFVVIHRMVSGIDSFPLLAVPFFILAGNLMNSAGITNRIYNFALALVGWLKGGLGHVNVVGSMIFAGMSGTAIADAAGWERSRSRR